MSRERSITYDWNGSEDDPPREGDVLVSARSLYLVVSIRRVRSRVHPCRWAIKAVKIGEEDLGQGERLLELRWNRRQKS